MLNKTFMRSAIVFILLICIYSSFPIAAYTQDLGAEETAERSILSHTISGTCFNDVNQNGTQDQGEAGVGGVTLSLKRLYFFILEREMGTTQTDPDGRYEFSGLRPGFYIVEVSDSGEAVCITQNPKRIILGLVNNKVVDLGFKLEVSVPTVNITANPPTITQGESATISWTTENADTVSIDQGIGEVAANDSQAVSPEETTLYTITAEGKSGTVKASVTITVNDPPPPPTTSIPIITTTISTGHSGGGGGGGGDLPPVTTTTSVQSSHGTTTTTSVRGRYRTTTTTAAQGHGTTTTVSGQGRYVDEIFSDYTMTKNLSYGSATGYSGSTETLYLDLYEPTGDTLAQRPAIVWVHGGAWKESLGDKTEPACAGLMAKAFAMRGYVCVSIEYRRSSTGGMGGSMGTYVQNTMYDTKAAVRWLRANAATYRIDPNRIAAGGDSAGGYAALSVGYTTGTGTEGTSGNPGYSSAVNAVIDIAGGLSPSTNDMTAGDPPLIIIHGTADNVVPYSNATDLVNRATAVGVPYDLVALQGECHVPYCSATCPDSNPADCTGVCGTDTQSKCDSPTGTYHAIVIPRIAAFLMTYVIAK